MLIHKNVIYLGTFVMCLIHILFFFFLLVLYNTFDYKKTLIIGNDN